MSGPTHGKLLGVGVGPGDPELMTLKAMRALGEADVVAHFAKAGDASHSRAIAARHLRAGVPSCRCFIRSRPNCRNAATAIATRIRDFYDGARGDDRRASRSRPRRSP